MIKIILYLITGLSILWIIDSITGIKLLNPFKVIGVFGKPGAGKSTLLTKWMYKDLKKGWEVYTDNTSTNLPGIKYFDNQKFKAGEWLPEGRKGYINEEGIENEKDRKIALYFDEMGITYNNREFKTNLNPETLAWWKKHRHARVKVIYGSQSYKDMDLKIRTLTQQLYIVNRSMFKNFSVAKPIFIKLDIANNENTENAGGQIIEAYRYDLFIFWKWIFLWKWIKKFDSYN